MSVKLTIEHCYKLARKREFECISKQYVNNKTKLEWVCKEKHVFLASYGSVSQGRGCSKCSTKRNADKQRKSLDQLCKEADLVGLTYLNKEAVSNNVHTEYQCRKCEKIYQAVPNSVQRGHGCSKCSTKCSAIKQRKSLEQLHKEADLGGLTYLNKEAVGNNVHAEYQCKQCESIHKAMPSNVFKGHGCLKCSTGKKRKSLDQLCKEADLGGLTYLNKEAVSNNVHTEYQCKQCENIHKAMPSNVKQGHGCPTCKNKTQRNLFTIIKALFPNNKVYNNYREFYWLRTKKGGKQEVDIFVEDIKLAIEYDGIQHFESVEHWGGDKALKRTQRLDKEKNQKIADHPEDVRHFIRFNYKQKITKELVTEKLKEAGICLESS